MLLKFKVICICLLVGFCLIGCKDDGHKDSFSTVGDLETLDKDASRSSQPAYQLYEILHTSYICSDYFEDNLRHPIKGTLTSVYSPYSGNDIPSQYIGYEVHKLSMSINLTDTITSLQINIVSSDFFISKPEGNCLIGMVDPETNNTNWEPQPILIDFKEYKIGESCNFSSSDMDGSKVISGKEYVTVGQYRYATWKTYGIQTNNYCHSETYCWINPQYGAVKMQMTQTSMNSGLTLFFDLILKESH